MADPQLFPLNPNLPPGWRIPGVYTSVILSDPGATYPDNRALLFGYKLPSGSGVLNTPFLGAVASEVEQACGKGSMLHKMYLAAKSQLPSGTGAELWLVPLNPPAGTAATHTITFLAAPTYDGTTGKWILASNTTASSSAICDIYLGGRKEASFVIANGDNFAAIATKAKAELDRVTDLTVTVGVAGAILTLTDVHAGEHGNDLPVRVDISDPACGVAASCGTLVFAGAAGANGSATVKFNVKSCQATIANADTAAISGTKMLQAINADAFPCLAAEPTVATGTVTLFFRNGRIVHRISTSVTGIAPQTLTANVGTAGAGVPIMTTALTNLASDSTAYRIWALPFTDAATWGAVSTHIEAQSVSPIEKGQVVHGAFSTNLTDTGPFPESTTPKLTATARYVIDWYQGSPNRAWESAARTAAMVAAGQATSLNYNFQELRGNETSPIGSAHRADRPTLDEQNTSINTYHLCPIAVNQNGVPAVVYSGTTYKYLGFIDSKLAKWSCILTLDYYRQDIRVYLFALFGKNKKVKVKSPARTSDAVTLDGVKAAVYRKVIDWDNRDLFDGGEDARDAIVAGVLVSPTRIDVALPMRPPADLDQISVVGYQQ